ncbi:MAG: methyltransferase domain-containing protein [Anaerolineales bacterium]
MDTSAQDRKARLAEHFDAVSSTYDGLDFLQVAARRFVECAPLSAGMSVLDVATGTGIVPLLAAEKIGAAGKIIGVDISAEMLAVAKQNLAARMAKSPDSSEKQKVESRARIAKSPDFAESQKVESQETFDSVQFQTGDAENLDFPNQSFDAVLCASSLFFIPDISKALKEARRVLKPNGFVLFNSFAPSFLQPLRQLWNERLQKHEIKIGSLPIHRIPDMATCQALLREAGFTQIDARVEQLGYYLPTIEERWQDIVAGLEGAPLKKMSAEQREQIRAEHFAELQNLMTPKGIWVDVPPIFALGRVSP